MPIKKVVDNRPRSFILLTGADTIAEGVRLSDGSYLVVYRKPEETVRRLTEDQLVELVEYGLRFHWSEEIPAYSL